MSDAEQFVADLLAFEGRSRHRRRRAVAFQWAVFRFLRRVAAKLRGKDEPPEDPCAYAMVRVKPRLPRFSAGATATLDD
jgi:hypothetical protein